MAAAVIHSLEESGRFEEAAREYGYNLTVTYKQFPFAPELIADASAGGIQIGTIATFPMLIQISQEQAIAPLHVSFGDWEFMIVVDKDGPIKDFDDLRGKTVGLAQGTTLQEFFEVFSLLELGGTPADLGIQIVQQPIPVAAMPPGIDAIVTYVPAWATLQERGNVDVLVNSFGETGPAYEGPLGSGAGHEVPSVNDSPFAPEGYVALRHFFNTFGGFEREHPDVVKAWLIAYQETLREFGEQEPSEVSEVFPEELWTSVPRDQYEELSIGRDLLYEHRDWIWPTDGELEIMVAETEFMVQMGLLEAPLTKEQILAAFEPNLGILQEAYEELGAYPEDDVFTDTDSGDVRGAPVWDVIP
ncbi:MAG: hypothetical protein M3406_16995 [Chloroflexota bacterium]|nr:hypothetical protein [Chloroflexota bacterium]